MQPGFGSRFVDFIDVLKKAVEEKRLPVYFNKDINLLRNVTMDLENLNNYLERIQDKGLAGYEELLENAKRAWSK